MLRTNIYLDDNQVADLDRVAHDEGVTRSDLIRRFIDNALRGVDDSCERDWAVIDATFGTTSLDMVRGNDGERTAHLDRMWQL